MPENLKWSERENSYYARKTKNGVEVSRKLDTAHKATARKRRDAWFKELEATAWGEKPRRTFDEAADRFENKHCKKLKPKSAKRYATSLKKLRPHFTGALLVEINNDMLLEFEDDRLADGVTSTTIIRDLACLSSIFSQAEIWDWADSNPVPKYKRMRRSQGGLVEGAPRDRYLSHDEEARLLPHLSSAVLEMVEFALDTGLRRSEQFGLETATIDVHQNEITVPESLSKSRKRTIPIWRRAKPIVSRKLNQRYLFTRPNGRRYSALSPWVTEELKKAAQKAGIKDLRWHDLRRTLGCRLLQDEGFLMEEVSLWLGHASVAVTQRHYAFLSKDQLHRALAKKSDPHGGKIGSKPKGNPRSAP